jgi:hypothetical protein
VRRGGRAGYSDSQSSVVSLLLSSIALLGSGCREHHQEPDVQEPGMDSIERQGAARR